MQTVDERVISGPHWSVVSAVGHSPSAMFAADITNWYSLLSMVGGVVW